jgi:hypothetical protein
MHLPSRSLLTLCVGVGILEAAETSSTQPSVRRVAPNETWEMRQGRFYRNGQWVFLKTGKLLRPFDQSGTADGVIAEIDVMVDRLNYNNFSLNIYPHAFDADADGRVDVDKVVAWQGIGRILDHCWQRGIFASLSFETYNVGGGGVPSELFKRHPEVAAVNALGEPARDVEYGGEHGKQVPSIFHPIYLTWSRDFIRTFIAGLGRERASRLLFVETTVEPQYMGKCEVGDKKMQRAMLDFSDAARTAYEQWRAALPENDRRRTAFTWPSTQAQRNEAIGNQVFNEFRAWALAQWVNGDIEAIRSVAPGVFVAVDYNGRFDDDDTQFARIGDHLLFLKSLQGVDIIQVAPHTWHWGNSSWEEVHRVNQDDRKGWAISENITISGASPDNDQETTRILDDTLLYGTRWGWECVNAGNAHERNHFYLYNRDWSSPVADVIEGPNWDRWLKKIGAPRFVPTSRPASQPASQ